MSDPFIGEIKLISFTFAPQGWAFCNGQTLPINQNQALFSILGTQYGGDGQTTFALPNLQARMPIHQGNSYTVGNVGGEVSHALTVAELPGHSHQARSATTPTGSNPTGTVWAASSDNHYRSTADVYLSSSAIGTTGAGLPHENQAPFLVLNYIIALQGVFPSRG
ncbi:MAG TPA: tail fiber protein [Jatrophihabitans sp.]|nr:tail fiber protein [Jatrophihabitans sp.]